jgi:cytochrome c peroxidase
VKPLLLFATLIAGCGGDAEPSRVVADASAKTGHADEINPRLLRRFRPVADAKRVATTPAEVALGRMLFFDKRLSLRDDISCNTCHPLDSYGVDHLKTSVGTAGQHGMRNAPSVYNASSHIAQFWDGRAATVEEQAVGPILNPVEMAMPDERTLLSRLTAIPAYVDAFRAAFPDDGSPVSMRRVGAAIGAFERELVTVSRWDAFLGGDDKALTTQEKHGLRLFLDVGCMGCHTGPQVGGTMFQRVGVVEPWPTQSDPGRQGVTNLESDRMVFKVPSLKNIANTAPYFHDGSVTKLPDAVRMMARHQLGIELTDAEVDTIVMWMGSMSGTVDPSYIKPPALP